MKTNTQPPLPRAGRAGWGQGAEQTLPNVDSSEALGPGVGEPAEEPGGTLRSLSRGLVTWGHLGVPLGCPLWEAEELQVGQLPRALPLSTKAENCGLPGVWRLSGRTTSSSTFSALQGSLGSPAGVSEEGCALQRVCFPLRSMKETQQFTGT